MSISSHPRTAETAAAKFRSARSCFTIWAKMNGAAPEIAKVGLSPLQVTECTKRLP
jgi:hypothetical protein